MTDTSTPPIHPVSQNSLKPPMAGMYPQFLLLGDSITQFSGLTFQAKLSDYYVRHLDVINHGLSGYNTRYALEALSQIWPVQAPSTTNPRVQLMTIFFGANDSVLPGNPQHVPLEEYRSNLRQIGTYQAARLHDTQVVFITPGPVDEWQLDNTTREAGNTARYAKVCREVAAESGVPVLDMWDIVMSKARSRTDASSKTEALPGSKKAPPNPELKKYLVDGLHFTDDAYILMFEELKKLIEQQVPDLSPERLPSVLPDWKAVMGVSL